LSARVPFRYFHTECDYSRIMIEEDTEQASEEKPSSKWLPWLFWGLFALVWFLISWHSGDWSVGWKYRTPTV